MTAPYLSGSLLSFPCGCAYQVASVDGAKPRTVRCADAECRLQDTLPACRSCSAPLLFAITEEKGRRMPIDPIPPGRGGNLQLFRRNGQLYCRQPADPLITEPLYASHFTSCPDASKHRRR